MPGLIEGAHAGKGLGITFLRHIERCRVLIHMVSMSGERDAYDDYLKINEELKEYGADLDKRPQIVVATKMDEEGAEERKAEFDKKLGFESIGISALTDQNVSLLMKKTYELIQKTPAFKLYKKEEINPGVKVYDAHEKAKETFYLERPSEHLFIIKGEEVIKKYHLINLSYDSGIAALINYLDDLGINEALAKKGAVDGDTVRIEDFEFEYTA